MKKILFAILICISAQNFGYSQSCSFRNKEIASVYNIICCDSTISLDMYLVNRTKNDIYMYRFFKNAAFANYSDSPERLIIEHSFPNRFISLELLFKLIKLKSGDTLFFDLTINCKNIDQIKSLTIGIDYLNPFDFNKRETKEIMDAIKPYPIDMEKNKDYYVFDKFLYFKYCRYIVIEIPWSCNDFKQTKSD